jgi:HlyD family secretion protein
MGETTKRRLVGATILVVALAAGFLAWRALQPSALPTGFASGNGRIEAVEIDIATKAAGRVKAILVGEGEFVHAGQMLATMDSAVLDAQLLEAQAQLQRAVINVETSRSLLTQREAERAAAIAVVAQRQAERDAATKRLARTENLAAKGASPIQTLDDDRAAFLRAKAAVSAAEAQVAASEAAIGYARSQIVAAEANVEAARATIQRIQADLDDSTLTSPRDGRVQYRVAQPGEILAAGGRVLNLVDLGDVYMTFFLPTEAAGRVPLGAEVRLVLDAAPQYVIPARASFVADVAQFTPKTVETAEERLKLMFRVKARVDPDLLKKHVTMVKTGLPGMAYVRLASQAEWPAHLQVRVPQ